MVIKTVISLIFFELLLMFENSKLTCFVVLQSFQYKTLVRLKDFCQDRLMLYFLSCNIKI